MATVDIEAEREKIQRQIEALERSLGPSAATCEEAEASDCSDDDDLDVEYGDYQTDDFGLGDGGDSVEMGLQMNLVYQAVIEEKLQELAILIAQNKDQQEQLLWELAGRKTQRAGIKKAYPTNLAVGHFFKPYFKDKFSGVGPPANQEMIERSAHVVKTFTEFTSRKWIPSYNAELRQAIVSGTLQRMLQPKLLKLEYLQQKLGNKNTDIDRKILTKQIQETEREIDDMNQLPEDALMGQRSDEHDWEKISNINFEGAQSSRRLRRVWQNYEHPHINKDPWDEEEIQKLQKIAESHNFVNWEEIAQELGTERTAFQCLQRFQLSNKEFKRKEFTKEEDEILTHFVQRMRVGDHIPYRKIAYFMEGRDPMQLVSRWSKSLDPSLTKGHWSKTEDEMLLKAVAKHGEKEWYKIRLEVPGRSDIQCRERYYKGLHKDVKKGKWSEEEREKLIALTEKYGVGHWTKISKELTQRNGAQCLSKWKHLRGYYKRKRQEQKHVRIQPKKMKEEVVSDEEASGSDSSSCSFSLTSSDTEDSAVTHSEEDSDPSNLHSPPALDLWIPRRTIPDSCRKSLIIHPNASGSTRTKVQRKGDAFQFNTILRGVAYPTSTDTVTDSPDVFLSQAADSGCQMLQIRENDVRAVLRRNTELYREQQVQRLKQKLRKCPAGSGKDIPGHETTEKSLSRFSVSQLYKASVDRRLLFAVTPWVGNVFLPLSANYGRKRRTHADVMRKKLHSVTITSTPIFTLLIQLFQIDAQGCLQMIRLRKVKETEIVRTIRSCTMRMERGAGTADPLSPKSLLVQSFQKQDPKVQHGGKPRPQGKQCISQPTLIAPAPPGIASAPTLIAPAPPGIASAPTLIAPAPPGIASAPTLIAPAPPGIASAPTLIAPAPPGIASAPTLIAPAPPGIAPAPSVRASAPTQKPKTVYELLMEKRMQQARARKAARQSAVLLAPPQILLQQQPNPLRQPQPMTINVAPLNAQKSVWPVVPFISLPAGQVILPSNDAVGQMSPAGRPEMDAGNALPVSQTDKAPESVNSKITSDCPSPSQTMAAAQTASVQPGQTAGSPLPVTWIVTPQGFFPISYQALRFPSPTQLPINQVKRDVSTSSEARAAETSTHETSMAKASEVPVDLHISNNETLRVVKSSLSQEATAMTSASVPPVPPGGPRWPIIAPAPNVPSKSSQCTWRPNKYPLVKIAKLLPSDHSGVNAVTVSKNGDPNPIPSSSTQTCTAGAEKNILDVSLISLEEEASVREWLQGKSGGVDVPAGESAGVDVLAGKSGGVDVPAGKSGGVEVPAGKSGGVEVPAGKSGGVDIQEGKSGGIDVPAGKSGMAYLPPSICTLKTFSRILRQKKALEESALTLLPHDEAVETVTSHRKQEILNDLVEQKLKDNPAYHLLKQRFLSAFTFPGFLASFPPAISTSVKEEEESAEDSDGSMYRDEDGPGGSGNNQSGDVPSGEVRLSEQEGAQCQSVTTDNTEDAKRRITRKSVRCRRLT
ncbi:snRNA-activating protein complex subunit 4 [Pseudophryne corroboree]|uniref:snRNA-activating protein complex subunit 4 n=1 Tax=Pseudophryne corroboree TaxID=495146 RepID=UPI003081BCDF